MKIFFFNRFMNNCTVRYDNRGKVIDNFNFIALKSQGAEKLY